jgi:hypothetical protein
MTPESMRLKLIKTLMLPHLDYCSFAYCNINKEQMKRLQGLLNAASRLEKRSSKNYKPKNAASCFRCGLVPLENPSTSEAQQWRW